MARPRCLIPDGELAPSSFALLAYCSKTLKERIHLKCCLTSLIFPCPVGINSFLQTAHKDCLAVLLLLLMSFLRPSNSSNGKEHRSASIHGISVFNVAGHRLATLDSSPGGRWLVRKLGFNLPACLYSTNWRQSSTEVSFCWKCTSWPVFLPNCSLVYGVRGWGGKWGYLLTPLIPVKTLDIVKIKLWISSCSLSISPSNWY